MTKLSDIERNYIIKRSAAVISQLQDGEGAVDILSEIYCRNLPDKSSRQGELMAKELLYWISSFQQACDEAMEEPKEYLCKAIRVSLARLSLEEQCEFLERALGSRTQLRASESLRDTLLREIVQEMLSGGEFLDIWMAAGENFTWKNVPAQNSIKEAIGEEMFLAVTAMVIYTMAKNGELTSAPEKVSLAQVTIGVCTEDKLKELRWITEMGYLEKTMLEKRFCTTKAACISIMLAAQIRGSAVGRLADMQLAALSALGGNVLQWLDMVLVIYYKVTAEMLKEEIAMIPYREIAASPVELTEEDKAKTAQKNLPWPEQQKTENKESQSAEIQKDPEANKYIHDGVDNFL